MGDGDGVGEGDGVVLRPFPLGQLDALFSVFTRGVAHVDVCSFQSDQDTFLDHFPMETADF